MKLGNLEKLKMFEKELQLIPEGFEDYKKLCEECILKAPEYFFTVSSSSSGKYHPDADCSYRGNLLHTKTVINVCIDLIRSEVFVKDEPLNVAKGVLACLNHDIIKRGLPEEAHTIFDHSLQSARFLEKVYKESKVTLNEDDFKDCIDAVKSHNGKWCTNNKDERFKGLVLPTPKTEFEKLIHMADYVASRKYIHMYEPIKNVVSKDEGIRILKTEVSNYISANKNHMVDYPTQSEIFQKIKTQIDVGVNTTLYKLCKSYGISPEYDDNKLMNLNSILK